MHLRRHDEADVPSRTMRRQHNVTRPRSQVGSTMLGLLGVLIALSVLAAIAVSAVGGLSGPSAKSNASSLSAVGNGNGVGTGVGGYGDVQVGLTATCVADFDGLSVASQTYEALHGAPPPAGTSWLIDTNGAGHANQSWPSLAGHFAFTWNGRALLVVPQHGTSSNDSAGSVTGRTGCYATSA